MKQRTWMMGGGSLAVLLVLAGACSESHVVAEDGTSTDSGDGDGDGETGEVEAGGGPGDLAAEPPCTASAASESECSDGKDDDCDGFIDCRDSECEGNSCGEDDGFSCTAGACLSSSELGLPELPRIDNVAVKMLGTTAIVTFEPVPDAKDYRIYPLPDPDEVLVGQDGEVVIPGAIYRCAGDRPAVKRIDDPAGFYDASLSTAEHVTGYVRPEGSELLGYVYLTAGEDRQAVYRVANPQLKGAYAWDYLAPWDRHYVSGEYTTDPARRDALVAEGQRNDGVQFYAPSDGDLAVHHHVYQDSGFQLSPRLYYTDGPEATARAEHGGLHETPFQIFKEQQEGTVPLYRVFYLYEPGHDTLAAGEPAYQRALEQGNVPFWSLTWSGLSETTTLVIEALDEGCPFPGGYVSGMSAPGAPEEGGYYPTFTLDEARLESDEVFINGQHDPENRPRPTARAYVDVSPDEAPDMDWYENFDDPSVWSAFEEVGSVGHGIYNWRNEEWAVELVGCTEGVSAAPLLGQLIVGGGDGGSSCNMSVIRRDLGSEVRSDQYLHVRMTTEIPSTRRRYPQMLITTAPLLEPEEENVTRLAVRDRLGPLPFEEDYKPGQGDYHSIIVQPFAPEAELQIEFCNRRGWGVSVQCPRANVYGFPAGAYDVEWSEPWTPVPLLGELTGHDRPVRFDAYISTSRVYVYVDDEPAACAVLPEDQMPEGPVTVIFGSVIYHGGIDESVEPETSPHQYLRRYSLVHYDRRFDEIGVDNDGTLPGWDETRLPCGDQWYGADE